MSACAFGYCGKTETETADRTDDGHGRSACPIVADYHFGVNELAGLNILVYYRLHSAYGVCGLEVYTHKPVHIAHETSAYISLHWYISLCALGPRV